LFCSFWRTLKVYLVIVKKIILFWHFFDKRKNIISEQHFLKNTSASYGRIERIRLKISEINN
jgi:hypothetical protein